MQEKKYPLENNYIRNRLKPALHMPKKRPKPWIENKPDMTSGSVKDHTHRWYEYEKKKISRNNSNGSTCLPT